MPHDLLEGDYSYSYVDVLVGTPPQLLSLVVDMQGDLFTVYSSECGFCAGNTFYDASQSSSYKVGVLHVHAASLLLTSSQSMKTEL